MKLGVSLYSFHSYASDASLGIKGCIDKAKEFGCEGVDFVEWGNGLSQEDYLRTAKEYGDHCRSAGVGVGCFCVGSDFLNRDLDGEVERVKRLVDVAAELGAVCIRHDATPGYPNSVRTGRSFDAVLPILADAYRRVTEYAKGLGLRTCIENHGFFAQDPDRIEKLINAVGNDNFGALIDIGNFACADADHAYAVGLLAPYAVHVHAKDFHKLPGTLPDPGEGWFRSRGGNYLRGSIIGHGNVPVKQCVDILKRSGYEGYLMIEFEGMEDPLKGIRIGVDNLRRFMNS